MECSKCQATLVSENKILAYKSSRTNNGSEAAYHWAVGVHTFINNDKPPCTHCDGLYIIITR
jgi:hypothetical protein